MVQFASHTPWYYMDDNNDDVPDNSSFDSKPCGIRNASYNYVLPMGSNRNLPYDTRCQIGQIELPEIDFP